MHISICMHTYVYVSGQYVTYTLIYRVFGYCSEKKMRADILSHVCTG